MRSAIAAATFTAMLALVVVTGPPTATLALQKKNQPKAKDPESARAVATVPSGHTVELWAAEPLMANPVAFCFDGQGRAYVAETTRFKNGVPDTRDHMYWLEEDVGSRSVEDRLKMYEKHKFGAKSNGYTGYDDQVRMVWDSTGAGYADKSSIFASGFNQLKDGLGSGVLAHKGSVYYTNIPDLYRLKDTKGTNTADVKESLATGFGVRAQYLGHDMHGLRMGPDGKLYFSIGDRGLNVKTKEGKHLFNPDSGAVLRCDPDGKNLEIVHVGLRNPQELAFDDFGNLFTYDNNCDSGDRARWVYIVEGGDSGWRCGYQYGDKGGVYHTPAVPQGNRGPWNTDKIWHLQNADQPAHIVPPLAHFGNGPAGLTHYPGIGLNDKYKDHFFACDFTSNPGGSKIWAVSVKPKGAAFEVNKPEAFVQNMVPTDCEFGPDGAFYWSDWVGGWSPPGKGRIFRVTDPEAMKNPAVGEAKKLFAEGFDKKTAPELAKLLEHPHQQVRLEALWELASRRGATGTLAKVLGESKNPLAKFHAVWGLGMAGNADSNAKKILLDQLEKADAELKCQILKTLARFPSISSSEEPTLAKFLTDSNLRVQFFAVRAYAKLEPPGSADLDKFWKHVNEKFVRVFGMLKANADQDVYLRQAIVEALIQMTTIEPALNEFYDKIGNLKDVPAVRLGMVLALRKYKSNRLASFLRDSDSRIVAEAARAIYDQELMTAMPALAALADLPGLPEPVAFRATAANFKLGKLENAARVAHVAARASESESLRAGALAMLAQWAKPKRLDIITGLTQDLGERNAQDAVAAVRPLLAKLFVGSDRVRREAVATTTKLGLTDVAPILAKLVEDSQQTAATRVDALLALDALKAQETAAAIAAGLKSDAPALRGQARMLGAMANPKDGLTALEGVLKQDSAAETEKQLAFTALGKLPESKEVDVLLLNWLQQLEAGKLDGRYHLDLVEAVQARLGAKIKIHTDLKGQLAKLEAAAAAAETKDRLARYRGSLAGGDPARGRDLFLNNSSVYCQRCHKLDGQGGDVGPAVNGIGKEKTREYLLESLVAPNQQIAKGYESVTLDLEDGRTVSGVLRSKTEKEYVIVTAENKMLTIPKIDVAKEKPDRSAMPDDLIKKLSPREVRDLVEFLASLKVAPGSK
jgi:quinoprotein glucose dehydrogenase